MKDYVARLLRNQIGFSMVQALVGLGVVGGLSLVVAQLGKQTGQTQVAASANYAIAEATAEIQSLLSNRQNCADTFQGIQLLENGKVNITGLRKNGSIAPLSLQDTGSNVTEKKQISITQMTLSRGTENTILTVNFRKNFPGSGTRNISRDFIINAKWDINNRIVDCASDVSNFIDTVAELALLKACPPIDPSDASENARRFLPDDENAPTACRAAFQLIDTNNNFICPQGSKYSGLTWANGRYQKVCRQIVNAADCAPDELLHKDNSGNLRCVSVSCPAGQVALGVDANGVMQCRGCANAGEILVSTSSGLRCVRPNCPTNTEMLTGVDSLGNSSCYSFIDTSSCPNGGRLVQSSGGVLKLECCAAICNDTANYCSGIVYPSSNGCGSCKGTAVANCSPTDAANHCIGTTYLSSNGCGTCTGTKPANCTDSGNYCSGQSYLSSNGCGACTGTRPSSPETSTWVETTTYRAKPGAPCVGGLVARERLRNKVCNGDAVCGGAACTPESQWVDDGSQSCSPPCTEGQIRPGLSISHTRNFYYCGGSSFSGDVWVSRCEKCIGGKWLEQVGKQYYYRTQNICSGAQAVPPSDNTPYCGSADPCPSGTDPGGYKTVPAAGGKTFNFCSFTMSGGGGCFIAGTKITLFDGTLKNIEDIEVGDELLDGSGKKVTVKKLLRIQHNGDIVSINGGGYFFTPNHPFLTTDGWKSLDPETSNKESPGLNVTLLKIGDVLVKKNGTEKIRTLNFMPTREQVYNFELDGSHEYIADGYVVHNKLAPPEEPWP